MTASLSTRTRLVHTLAEYQALRKEWANQRVAVVPTMGALHHGHLSLVQLAQQHADRVVVTIFVNPLQFGKNEDYNQYPRTLEKDVAACDTLGVDCVFAPNAEEVYPDGLNEAQLTRIVPPAHLSEQLCGLSRPGHFTGVATVVGKLFEMIQPDVAVFGEKDAQQLAVIQHMARDLNFPITILPHPIVRKSHGLALSSRNKFIDTREALEVSLVIPKTLFALRDRIARHGPESRVAGKLSETLDAQLAQLPPALAGRFSLEYLEARDADTLQPVARLAPGVRVLMAAKIALGGAEPNGDTVRLIDNILL